MRLQSVNVGHLEKTNGSRTGVTGHRKRPVESIDLVSPTVHRGISGVVGDEIGDPKHHGGIDQAVYVVAREDLDEWEGVLGQPLPDGSFGENLTTVGIDVNQAVIGERWRIGTQAELTVTDPRNPCRTFADEMQRPTWVKEFTALGKPGTYLRIEVGGTLSAGDPITVIKRPGHGITIAEVFAALTIKPDTAKHCLTAAEYLPEPTRLELMRRAAR